MPAWRDDKILELANQLTYSPADKRTEQLGAAISLLVSSDATKPYPWDYIHFRITGFSPRDHSDHLIPGKTLRADLSTLIEFLSNTLDLKSDQASAANDTVLTLEQVTQKFNVSSKTIQRWRKDGLIALRYIFPDGRRRIGFLDSAVTNFAESNKTKVDRSAAFKQLSDDERTTILSHARAIVTEMQSAGVTPGIKEISLRISGQINRAAETIRYTLRKHDHDHPENPIFPDPDETPRKPTPLSHQQKPHTSPFRVVLQQRAAQLKHLPIDYIHNPLFIHPDADNIILSVLPAEALAAAQDSVLLGKNARTRDVFMARTPSSLPAFLADIFRQPLMPLEIETDYFRRMNYLKYKAAKFQLDLIAEEASPTALADIETLLVQAHDLKNQLVQSNLRVAAHVARKHQRPDRPLIELVSDATIWLMRAVDTFDFARVTKFTTYASYALMKNFARDRAEQLTRRDKSLVTGQQELLDSAASPDSPLTSDALDAAALQTELLAVIQELPDRERQLLTTHYGLNENNPLSLAEIGNQMGITKARVRQLEARALRKLRQLMQNRPS